MADTNPISNSSGFVWPEQDGEQAIDRDLNELFQDLEQTLSQGQPLSTELVSAALARPSVDQAMIPAAEVEDTDTSSRSLLPEAYLESLSTASTATGESFAAEKSQRSDPNQPSQPGVGAPLQLIWQDLRTASYGDRLLFGIACSAWILILLLGIALQLQAKLARRPAAPLPVATSPSMGSAPSPKVLSKPQPSTQIAIPSSPAQQLPQITPPVPKVPPTPPTQIAPKRIVSPVPAQIPPPPQPVPVPRPPATSAKPAPVVATTPPPGHVLTGLMELGDRSVALVTTNGATRRIQVGETIDPSGWRLVKIAEQKAVLQRSGEQRAVDVGQSF